MEGLQTIRSRWANLIQPFSLSVCSIHDGSAINIIPDGVVLEGIFRYAQESYEDRIRS
jgi:metal-dependent amidase/aminoacylase/carboxypeptidase family protein